ncbi:MAG: GNAT family N-acetyltransferase [Bryobacteraceae bacterium]|nr:GNAT family N-acetyltransferase [Bryobacteraceae bacterium]
MIKVRLAGSADVALLAQFNCQMARETEQKTLDLGTVTAGVASLVAQPAYGFYIIAERDGEPAGCLMITYEWTDWRNGVFWWIQSVYVHEQHRRQGVFRHLHEDVRRRAKSAKNVRGFRLYVESHNEAAQATYRGLGFTNTGYLMLESPL